jgi:hypothetical protein
MSNLTIKDNNGIQVPLFLDIQLPSGNIVKVKNGLTAFELNSIAGELIDLSLEMKGK